MTLMKLAPEIVRLRRVAKAYAAGEFSRLEYRRARAEVIENFQPDVVSDDVTRPRLVPGTSSESPPPPRKRPPRIGWRWFAGVGLLALIVALAATQAQAQTNNQGQAAVRIGAVSERNPNPLTSPRIAVAAVQIRDFQAYPGIDSNSVDALIEAALTDIRSRNVEGGHGFTASELEEVGRFLNILGVHRGGDDLSARDAADLKALITGQKHRRGVSIVELEEVAARVQEHYRDAGYFLAVVYVPVQEPQGDIVELSVLPGVLGDVVVNGGDAGLVASRFADALGEPVTQDAIASRLYQLNRLPGLTAQAAFEPGNETGETRLNLDVIEQRTWSATVIADNHGDDSTGEERLTVLASWLNPRGAGDLLDIGLLQTIDRGNQTYGFGEYTTPLNGVNEIRARVANNSFTARDGSELDGSELDGSKLDGDGVLFDLTVRRELRRSRNRNTTVEIGLRHHRFSWQAAEDQTATFATAILHSHRIWDAQQIAAGVSTSADLGRFSEGAFAGQDKGFWRLGVDAYAWKPISLPWLGGEQKLAARLSGQISDSQLPSSTRLSLGGFSRARGFQRDTFLADQGVIVGLDLRVPVAVGELVLFVDTAYGKSRNDLTPNWGRLTDIGLGWDADLLPKLMSRLSLAFPLSARGSADLDDDSPQFFWQLQYAY
jgi:hemolysin activation/secretion protein